MVRVWFPYQTTIPFCGDYRRWPNVLYECEKKFQFVSADKIVDLIGGPYEADLKEVLRGVWYNVDDADGGAEHEWVISNTIDAIVDEIDRRQGRPNRPRPPPNGGSKVTPA